MKRLKMQKWLISIVALVVLGIVGYLVIGRSGLVARAAEGKPPANTPVAGVKMAGDVIADGIVTPARSAKLSMASGGILAEALVTKGASVVAGQPLLRLHAARQQAAVAGAEAQLARAQSGLDQVQAGARSQEVEAAAAGVAAARAQLARLQQGALPAEIAAAEAVLAGAQAALLKVKEGATDQALIAARADLANAEALVRQAQTAYDRVKNASYIGMLPESLALEQATNAHTAARARLTALQDGASTADIAGAVANVQRAQAQLDALKAPARSAEIAAAQAEIRRAEAQLELVQAGARPEAVAAAQADVAAAQAALLQAQAALDETELRAPFAGVVAALNVKVGEQVVPGVPVIVLADLSAWQIETDDLTEISVVRIHEGDAVTITVDAFPDLKLSGWVTRIEVVGEKKVGDMTYTVVVTPDQQDSRLRWNMTASVTMAAQ